MENESIQLPFQIVSFENSTLELRNSEILNRILDSNKLKNHQVVVVSIAGALREGKSFLLNFFLRYLNAQYKKHNVEDWIGRNRSDEPLTGFSWRSGTERETIGIWMWSEIFTHDFSDDDKVAIILMDTQGIFDSESDIRECISIFAMSMLLSSVQCYNVMRQIREDYLTNLHLFSEYAKFAMQDSNEKPFQKLMFTIRDWQSPNDYSLGSNKKYVDDKLSEKANLKAELCELRRQIKDSFADIDAFLMPYPGRVVAEQNMFCFGEIRQMEHIFVDCVEELTEELFAPEKLIRKQIGGQTIQAAEFLEYLMTFIGVFSGEELPPPITILRATTEAHLKSVCKQCLDLYLDEMDEALTDTDVYCDENELQQKHTITKDQAILQFNDRRKLGSPETQSDFMELLRENIEKAYAIIHDTNKNQKQTVETKKKRIFVSITVTTTVAGAIGTVFVGGPLCLGLFTKSVAEAGIRLIGGLIASGATGGGAGGASIGVFSNRLLPRKWFVISESALNDTIKSLKKIHNNTSMDERSTEEKQQTIESASAETANVSNSDAVDESDSTTLLPIRISVDHSNLEATEMVFPSDDMEYFPRVFETFDNLIIALHLAKTALRDAIRRFIFHYRNQ